MATKASRNLSLCLKSSGSSPSLLCHLSCHSLPAFCNANCAIAPPLWCHRPSFTPALLSLVGFPQVAAKPRRAPQKRRLTGSTVVSSHRKRPALHQVEIIVLFLLMNHLWLERSYWTGLEWEWLLFVSYVDLHFSPPSPDVLLIEIIIIILCCFIHFGLYICIYYKWRHFILIWRCLSSRFHFSW